MKFYEKLSKFKLENPDAQIKFEVNEDISFWEHSNLLIDAENTSVYLESLTVYGNKLLDRDDLFDEIHSDFTSDDTHNDKTEPELEDFVESEVNKYNFDKIIIVRISE